MGEEARSLRRSLARRLPGRLDDIERRVPGEGEQDEPASVRDFSPWPKLCSSS
jgi:hypothetical protein